MENKLDKYFDFCIRPWTHLDWCPDYIDSCCWSRTGFGRNFLYDKESNKSIINDIWNSDFYQNYRTRMLYRDIRLSCGPNQTDISCQLNCEPSKSLKYFSIRNMDQKQKDNLNLCFENIQNQKIYINNYPISLKIYLDYVCNFKCPMCYQKDFNMNKSIDIDKYEEDFDDMLNSLLDICLIGGEPTYSKNYDKLMIYFKDKRQQIISICTNGSRMDKIIEYINNIKIITISMDSTTEEIYSKIRVNGNFNSLIKNIEKLNDSIKQNNIKIKKVSKFCLMPVNIHQVSDMVRLSIDMGFNEIQLADDILKNFPLEKNETNITLIYDAIKLAEENKLDYLFDMRFLNIFKRKYS